MNQQRMDISLTRNNHFVPIWYQKRFLAPGESKYFLLDLAPDLIHLPDGRTIPREELKHWGPKQCFFLKDLYTTFFDDFINDEIEKRLFGAIDDRGSRAIGAFSKGDFNEIHTLFGDFFEFLDAQKLRTPKGLAWIASRYKNLNQVQLMREMQGLQYRHCTMWAECVREIVSASESDVKFIVTDHPVTVYNPALSPDSPACIYPNDPAIELLGTQTIYALDADTCLILTNLEYAQNPEATDPTVRRTNSRFSGGGLVNTHAFIRDRKLKRDEVIAINYLLKTRCCRYIAAPQKDWLYPEKYFNGAWREIAQTLLPRDGVHHFGGEIYIGYKDGSTRYQDSFGRTSGSHEYLRRKQVPSDLKAEDQCGCGSGKTYKVCCMDLAAEARPTWDVYGLRERNLLFCWKIQKILGLLDGKSWNDVRRELNDDHVVEIYKAFASLWPEDTDLAQLLPRPTPHAFRVVYLGAPNIRALEVQVTGWLAYFDEIVLPHPFYNPVLMKPDFSPIQSPSQHREQTLKNALMLTVLEPFIQQGLVHLVPSPGDYNHDFIRTALQMAEDRTGAAFQVRGEDKERQRGLWSLEHRRILARLPDADLHQYLAGITPEAPADLLDRMVAQIKRELEEDPMALLQPLPAEGGGQVLAMKGFSLEVALYLAAMTGSAVYTDMLTHWDHLHQQTSAATAGSLGRPSLEAWERIVLPFEIGISEVLADRSAEAFKAVRAALRATAAAVREAPSSNTDMLIADQASIASAAVVGASARERNGLVVKGRMKISAPAAGFERPDVTRLLLNFGAAAPSANVVMSIFAEVFRADGDDKK